MSRLSELMEALHRTERMMSTLVTPHPLDTPDGRHQKEHDRWMFAHTIRNVATELETHIKSELERNPESANGFQSFVRRRN